MRDETVTPLAPSLYRRDAAGADKKAALPGADDPYQAAGNADGHEIPLLVLIMGMPPYHAFEYVHIQNLVWDDASAGEVIRFIYAGFEPKRVAVYGSGLLRLWHQMGLRQIPWIRQAERDFRAAGAASAGPVITKIVVVDWVRPAPQAKALAEALEAFEEA